MSKFNKLSRAEMKNVLGGTDGPVQCTALNIDGTSTTSCYGSLSDCQDNADSDCEGDDNCNDSVCKEV